MGVEVRTNDPAQAARWTHTTAGSAANNTAPHTDYTHIPGVWWVNYTPTTVDVGNYLRMYEHYETVDGTWSRRNTLFTTSVVSR